MVALQVLGVTKTNLIVNLFEAEVTIFIGPDNVQNIAVWIGSEILNKNNGITVIKNENVRLFTVSFLSYQESTNCRQKRLC